MGGNLNKHDKVSLALHAAVKRELLSDSERVLGIAKNNLERWRRNYDVVPKWMREWDAILDLGVSAVVAVLDGEDEVSTLMRSSSPFTGVISQQERSEIIKGTKEQSGASSEDRSEDENRKVDIEPRKRCDE